MFGMAAQRISPTATSTTTVRHTTCARGRLKHSPRGWSTFLEVSPIAPMWKSETVCGALFGRGEASMFGLAPQRISPTATFTATVRPTCALWLPRTRALSWKFLPLPRCESLKSCVRHCGAGGRHLCPQRNSDDHQLQHPQQYCDKQRALFCHLERSQALPRSFSHRPDVDHGLMGDASEQILIVRPSCVAGRWAGTVRRRWAIYFGKQRRCDSHLLHGVRQHGERRLR